MKQIQLEDFLEYSFLSNLEANGTNTQVGFLKSKANLTENNYQFDLMLFDGKEIRKAVSLDTHNRYYWENETSILVPYAKSDDEKEALKNQNTVLYKYDLKLKTFDFYKKLLVPLSNLKVVNDSTWILNTSLTKEAHILYEDNANRQTYLESLKSYDLYEEITSIPFYADGGTFLRNALNQILIYNPLTKVYKRILDKDMRVMFSDYNKDTNKIYILAQKHTGIHDFHADAYIYDVEKETLTKVYNNDSLAISSFFEINKACYFLASDMKSVGLNTNKDFYILENNEAKLHTKFGLSTYNSTGSDVRFGFNKTARIYDDVFYFVGTYKDRSPLYKFDGSVTQVLNDKGSIDGWIKFNDELIGVGLFNHQLQELYNLSKEIQLSDFNEDILKDKYVAKARHHEIKNGEITIDGWVLLPQDYDSNKSYPAILDIHGGPKTIYNENFFHEMQVWVNLGYIVFFSNPRGSDGYGDDFADIRGKYGTIDYDDLMMFTDFVCENYSIDQDRMGVTGGSYGGFMTNWIVSHTDRFKAAATQRSISNWISFYGTSDIGYYFQPDQTDADPILEYEKAWEQSPLKHAYNIKTPLLFIHSDQDYRCPIEQAMQLYTVVKKQGIETRFIWFKNESHGLSRDGKPKARVKRLSEITEWFNTYLK